MVSMAASLQSWVVAAETICPEKAKIDWPFTEKACPPLFYMIPLIATPHCHITYCPCSLCSIHTQLFAIPLTQPTSFHLGHGTGWSLRGNILPLGILMICSLNSFKSWFDTHLCTRDFPGHPFKSQPFLSWQSLSSFHGLFFSSALFTNIIHILLILFILSTLKVSSLQTGYLCLFCFLLYPQGLE